MCFLYSLKRFAYHYLQAFPSIMSYTNKTWKKIYDFVYYRADTTVSFASVTCFDFLIKGVDSHFSVHPIIV